MYLVNTVSIECTIQKLDMLLHFCRCKIDFHVFVVVSHGQRHAAGLRWFTYASRDSERAMHEQCRIIVDEMRRSYNALTHAQRQCACDVCTHALPAAAAVKPEVC